MNNAERGKKIAAAKSSLRLKNKYQGGKIPFGYRKKSDGTIEECPDNFEVLQKIEKFAHERKNGDKKVSSRKIAELIKKLTEVNISYKTVARIIKRTLSK